MAPAAMWVAALFLVPLVWTVASAVVPARGGTLPSLLIAAAETSIQRSVVRTVVFAIATVSVQMLAGTCIGLAVGSLRRFRLLVAALLSVPLFMPPIVVGLQWRWLLDSSRPGFPVALLGDGFEGLSDPKLALPLLGVISSWQWTPFVALVIASTAARLPPTVIATAALDGLPSMAIYRAVIWPHIRSAFYWTLAWRLVDTLRTFDLVYVVTQGGPGSSTELLSFTVFQEAFVFLNEPEAAGAATLLLIVSLLLLLITMRSALAGGDNASQ